MFWEPYPSHHNGLFSPLLVLRDFAAGSADHSRSEPLQVSGSTSAGRVICGTDLAECVSVPGDFLRPQGAFPPGFYLLREGWVHCPAPEAPLTRGMPKGPRVFLTNSGRVWATALRPVPPKKRPCAIHARKVGRASNTADHSRSEPLQVSGSASAGRVICGTDLAKCVSVPGDFLRPQGAFPPGFYLLREGWVHCPAPEAPLTRGMPRGPRVFLTNSGRVWATALRPVPPKKRPCAIHARKVGRASNTADQSRSEPFQLPGSTSAGRVICGTDLAECVSVPGDFLRPQGAFPPGFYLLREGWVHRPAPEAPLIRGMPTGP